MSITKAKLNNVTVYASQGEELRGKDVTCLYCSARMHVTRFKTQEGYYFALCQNERHEGFCENYEGEKNIPEIKNKSPEDFIDMISKVTPKYETKGVGVIKTQETEDSETKDVANTTPAIRSLRNLIKVLAYDVEPYSSAGEGLNYNYIDIVIYRKWAREIWRGNDLANISSRVVDARWIGSFEFSDRIKTSIEKYATTQRSLWFKTFWRQGENYKNVFFWLDCGSTFSAVKTKLFAPGQRTNGTFTEYIPKGMEKLDVLIGAKWVPMDKEQCQGRCPVKKCENCLGAYWGKCNSVKQIEAFPEKEMTKGKKYE